MALNTCGVGASVAPTGGLLMFSKSFLQELINNAMKMKVAPVLFILYFTMLKFKVKV